MCKQVTSHFINKAENIPRKGAAYKFSDIEIVALKDTSETFHINRESL